MSSERAPLTSHSLDELDADALESLVRVRAPGLLASSSVEEAAVRVGLAARMGSKAHPTPVGLLMVGKAPELALPEWGVAAACLRGTSLNDSLVARADVGGPLPALVEASLAFVREHAALDAGVGQPEFPLDAVREVLVNALVHRDLRKPARVMLRVFSDRLELHSPGALPEGLGDLDDLFDVGGVSVHRNPLLASLARALGLGEHLGRGLPLVRRASERAGGRPELVSSPSGVLVTIPSRLRSQRPLALS
jgi:ATP-dependent DNA helicase RecG